MATLPITQYTSVMASFAAATIDGIDSDTLPDFKSLRGTVTFTPYAKSVVATTATGKKTIFLMPIVGSIDADGDLCTPATGTGTAAVKYVKLVSGDADNINTTGFAYKVSFNLTLGGMALSYPSFDISAPANTIVDLSDVTPVGVVDGIQIIKGDKGDTGATGATPKLIPGTLTAVPADAQLTFDVVESEPGTYVVNATVPQGKTGEPGAPGQIGPAGMVWRGLWAADVDYVDADAVSYNGSSWFAAENPPVGEVPSDSSGFWNVLSLHGAQGDRGPAGLDGANAPIPQITFTATTLPAGSSATVSQSGVYPLVNVALGIPQGADGAAGSGGGGGSSEPTMEWRGYNNGFGGYTDGKGPVNNRYFFKRVGNRVFCRFELTSALWYEQQNLINFYGSQMQGLRPLRDVVQRTGNSWADGLEKQQASMVMKTDGGTCSVYMNNITYNPNSTQMVPYFFEFDYVTADPFPAAPTPTFFTALPANASTADWAAI